MPTQIYRIYQEGNPEFNYVGSTSGGENAIRKMIKRIERGQGHAGGKDYEPSKGILKFRILEEVNKKEKQAKIKKWLLKAPELENEAINEGLFRVTVPSEVESKINTFGFMENHATDALEYVIGKELKKSLKSFHTPHPYDNNIGKMTRDWLTKDLNPFPLNYKPTWEVFSTISEDELKGRIKDLESEIEDIGYLLEGKDKEISDLKDTIVKLANLIK
jgi:hypothetical protein